jgi:Tfp pilus assembly protein PilN
MNPQILAFAAAAFAFLLSIVIVPCIKLFFVGARVADLQTKTEQLKDQMILANRQLEEIASFLARAKALDQAIVTGSSRGWTSAKQAGSDPERANQR